MQVSQPLVHPTLLPSAVMIFLLVILCSPLAGRRAVDVLVGACLLMLLTMELLLIGGLVLGMIHLLTEALQ